MLYITRHQNRGKFGGKIGIDIFRTFKFITRLSKYDFWIPDEISDWCMYFFFTKYFFFEMKKNIAKIFFWEKMRFFWQKQILRFLSIEKSFKIDFPKIDFKWLFNWNFRFSSLKFFSSIFFSKYFFKLNFLHEKKRFFDDFFLKVHLLNFSFPTHPVSAPNSQNPAIAGF